MLCCCDLNKYRIKSITSLQQSYCAANIVGLWIIQSCVETLGTHVFFIPHNCCIQAFCTRYILTILWWELWQDLSEVAANCPGVHRALQQSAEGKTGVGRHFFVALLLSITHKTSRGISEMEVLTEDSWRAPAFPSGRLMGILLQDTSSTIALFYINNKIQFMQLRLM